MGSMGGVASNEVQKQFLPISDLRIIVTHHQLRCCGALQVILSFPH